MTMRRIALAGLVAACGAHPVPSVVDPPARPAGRAIAPVVAPPAAIADGAVVRTPAKRKRNGYLEWLIVIVVAMTSALVVRAFVVQQF